MAALTTYLQRLNDVAGRLEGLGEDMASGVDEGTVDMDAYDAVNAALTSVERAVKLTENKE